jgi:hypothetical protein
MGLGGKIGSSIGEALGDVFTHRLVFGQLATEGAARHRAAAGIFQRPLRAGP